MKVIDTAFNEAISKTPAKPRGGWWGCYKDGVYFIMRYQHYMIRFNESQYKVFTNETRTDAAGINNAIQLILEWQKTI